MKKLELNQMSRIEAGGCGGWGWTGFAVLVVVGVVAAAAVVATGGAAAALLATGGGKLADAALTAGGLGAIDADCD